VTARISKMSSCRGDEFLAAQKGTDYIMSRPEGAMFKTGEKESMYRTKSQRTVWIRWDIVQ